MQSLPLFVANAEIHGAPSDPNYADVLRKALEVRLKAGGYDLVDVASPHRVTAKIVAEQDKDHPEVWNYALTIDSPDGTVDRTTATWAGSDDATVSLLVDPLARSERLVAFAQHDTGGAVPAPIAETPSAIPAAAPPSVPPPSAPAPAFVSAAPQPNAYAVIVGVEKYSAGLPVPVGARGDAERFAAMTRSSLGVDPGHIQVILDDQATRGRIAQALDWAKSSTPPGGRVYFYFSGHGAPDASGGTPYIVPADGDPRDLDATALALKDVLAKLGQSKAREVLAIVDSCFSGAGGRSVLPPGARPIVRVRDEAAPAQVALLSGATGAEISGPTPGGAGGLFTKYVLEGLGTGAADINGDGQVSLGELAQWVPPRVSREARKDNRDQNPSLTLGKGLGSSDGFIVEWGLPAR